MKGQASTIQSTHQHRQKATASAVSWPLLENPTRSASVGSRPNKSVPWWQCVLACGISFFLGRITSFSFAPATYIAPAAWSDAPQVKEDQSHLLWELNMRRARSYKGITTPMNNGYSAKCIPDGTMSQFNARIATRKLVRSRLGFADGLVHEDEDVLSVGQVGNFASKNMNFTIDGNPIWTLEIWKHFQNELIEGRDGGPPAYGNSGKSVSKAVSWVLENTLGSCGVWNKLCHLSVFSAISPWAEAIMFWSASKLLRHNTRITSIDFNPCVLDNIPPNTIAECLSPMDLIEKSDILFDLTVSYSGIEHDGLGRYGDPVNPDGDVSAMREMWLLTRPGGVLLLAVPRASKKNQPQTDIQIWGDGKIHVLQHRNYGAERYMRLLVGWVLEGWVVSGKDVIKRKQSETKIASVSRMLQCSYTHAEGQPLLILRKLGDMTFDDVLLEGDWSADNRKLVEENYLATINNQNVTC